MQDALRVNIFLRIFIDVFSHLCFCRNITGILGEASNGNSVGAVRIAESIRVCNSYHSNVLVNREMGFSSCT